MNQFYAGRKLGLLVIVFSLSLVASANTYTVTNANSTGPGSFEQAILDANLNPGADIIDFNIPGTGPFVIAPTGFPGLPVITDAVSIRGYTQPGSTMGPMATRVIQIVVLGNPGLGFSSGITINSDNVDVSGLSIGGFNASGITVQNGHDNVFIWGNFLGMDPTGAASIPNGYDGVNLGDDGSGGGSDNITVGTNSDGTNDNAEGNLISANGVDGIGGLALTNSIISGNFIGSNRLGTGSFGNLRNGILLTATSTGNRIGTNGDNTNDTEELNGLINNGVGIEILANSNNNVVAGNIIGINTAQVAAGNGIGIEIWNSSNNRVGVNTADANAVVESNIISSNTGNGLVIRSGNPLFPNTDPATGNVVAGNYIGTTPTNASRGNGGNGILFRAADGIVNAANTIGSNNDGANDIAEGNIIANNTFAGIATENSADIFGNMFSHNAIRSNGGLGIDLAGNGVTPNDDGDGDSGPNGLFNFPVILTAHGDGVNLTITGVAESGSQIEFYISDGSGEGATYLFRALEGGTIDGITDMDNNPGSYSDGTYGTFNAQAFSFTVPINTLPVNPNGATLVTLGIEVTNDNSTSEFGPAVLALPITLSNFKAQLVDGLVRLAWNTSSEINASHFDIEKAIDGSKFSPIGRVKAGALNHAYTFVDNTPFGKLNYYRLKMVDKDGHSAYSKTLIIRNDGESLIVRMTPNPVSSYMNLSFKLEKDELVRVNVFDQTGRVVRRYTLQGGRGVNAFTLSDIGNLPSGSYVVDLKGETISAKQQVIKK